mmetsp:Transcript_18267/g.21608  ORF Transcript_18267/g.21608 Transcript_18267/m.21608 type:complete len:301 (-) Transcript_18267:207-1109(-)
MDRCGKRGRKNDLQTNRLIRPRMCSNISQFITPQNQVPTSSSSSSSFSLKELSKFDSESECYITLVNYESDRTLYAMPLPEDGLKTYHKKTQTAEEKRIEAKHAKAKSPSSSPSSKSLDYSYGLGAVANERLLPGGGSEHLLKHTLWRFVVPSADSILHSPENGLASSTTNTMNANTTGSLNIPSSSGGDGGGSANVFFGTSPVSKGKSNVNGGVGSPAKFSSKEDLQSLAFSKAFDDDSEDDLSDTETESVVSSESDKDDDNDDDDDEDVTDDYDEDGSPQPVAILGNEDDFGEMQFSI